MPIDDETLYLMSITESAIRKYSEERYAASWMTGVELTVLEGVMKNDSKVLRSFIEFEVVGMNALISKGYWVSYADARNEVFLSKEQLTHYLICEQLNSQPNGAD